MAKRTYTALEAYDFMCQSDEDNEGEWDSEFEDIGSEYEPDEDSDTLTAESDDEGQGPDTSIDEPTISGLREDTTSADSQRRGRKGNTKRRRTAVPEEFLSPVWSPASFDPPLIPPFTGKPGIAVEITDNSPIKFMELIISDELLGLIVQQTNVYAEQYIAEHPRCSYAEPKHWRPTTIPEMKTFLGFLLNMGITKKPNVKSYWSTKAIYHMPIYSSTMSRTRFLSIMKFLHFNDNTCRPEQGSPEYDRLYKIRPLIDFLSRKFAEVYTPDKNISLDESLVHFTGRLKIKQYIPSKRSRYGIKLYKICESATGYTWAFRIYEGKDSQLEPPGCPPYMGTNGKVVWDLISPFLNNGYHLYVDNYYTSIPLFKHLFSQKTLACGTLRTNRKGLPQSLIKKRLEKGETENLRSEEMLLVKYKDKREVYVLSTLHTPAIITRSDGQQKPECIHDYNQYMGGVDRNDQMMKPYLVARKTFYWYKKVAIYLIQLGIFNSFLLYKKKTKDTATTYLSFQEEIITSLLSVSEEEGPSTSVNAVARLRGKHYPAYIPPTSGKKYPQKKMQALKY
ncbi:piggyBac transposable element-derived protein 4-like [Hyperolius riggenbachi]|uniref:piggyBac transposable element-derived protein 4-like n=1 Tax=Hyperolius riggenbachi TaxID=752182 RepID=UPI0035A2AD97